MSSAGGEKQLKSVRVRTPSKTRGYRFLHLSSTPCHTRGYRQGG